MVVAVAVAVAVAVVVSVVVSFRVFGFSVSMAQDQHGSAVDDQTDNGHENGSIERYRYRRKQSIDAFPDHHQGKDRQEYGAGESAKEFPAGSYRNKWYQTGNEHRANRRGNGQ